MSATIQLPVDQRLARLERAILLIEFELDQHRSSALEQAEPWVQSRKLESICRDIREAINAEGAARKKLYGLPHEEV